jgi:predicted nucleic acid-binding protein
VIVLVDTNVLLDVALNRSPHAASASELLDLLERRPQTGFVAGHAISTIAYLIEPRRRASAVRDFIADIARVLEVAPTTSDSLRFATRLPMPDFEDAMQVAAAHACGADLIATRNVRDYSRSPIRAVSPANVIAMLR